MADLSSRAAAGLEPLTFLAPFIFSSLMGVTGTEEDMALTWKSDEIKVMLYNTGTFINHINGDLNNGQVGY